MTATPGVVIYALDPERLAAYYVRVAGLAEAGSDDGDLTLVGGGLTLHLVRVPEQLAAQIALTDPVARRSDTALKLVLPVPDLAAARGAAPAYGAVVDPVEAEWAWAGVVRCDGHDPEGNVVQLTQPLGPAEGVGATA